jgi:hypothetical protein
MRRRSGVRNASPPTWSICPRAGCGTCSRVAPRPSLWGAWPNPGTTSPSTRSEQLAGYEDRAPATQLRLTCPRP